MSWGTRRRNSIIFTFITAIFILLAIYLFNVLYEPANCFDGKQNADEAGVDCGGSCVLMCQHQVLDPIIRWTRYFNVSQGIYNVVAYVENPNPTGGIEKVSYQFKLYDADNALIRSRSGVISLPPKAIIPITGNSLETGELTATRLSFEFTSPLIWTRQPRPDQVLVVEDERLLNEDTQPQIVATIQNTAVIPKDNVKVVAIVYDRNGNAIAVSSTLFDRIPATGSVQAFFTWPQPFGKTISRFELIPVYDQPSN
jgi:hypothetical protein